MAQDVKPHKLMIIIKSILFFITLVLLVSLFASKDIIRQDFYEFQQLSLSFKDYFKKQEFHHNLAGLIGVRSSFYFVAILGHVFSIFLLLNCIIYLSFSFANFKSRIFNRLTLFFAFLIIILYFFNFYQYSLAKDFLPSDRYIFTLIYSFIFAFLGTIGTIIFICILFVANLELLVHFNPFKIFIKIIQFIANYLATFYKPKKEIIQIEDDIKQETQIKKKKLNNSLQDQIPIAIEDILITTPEESKKTIFNSNDFINQLVDVEKYRKPDIESFLYKPHKEKTPDKSKLQAEISEVSKILIGKLAQFAIDANVIGVNVGPIITQYELEPAPGIKVNKFTSLSDDLALALKAKSIRVQAPIPGRGLIGVEIPNRLADVIYIRDIFLSNEMKNSDAILSVALGKDIAGRPVVTDLAKMPHLLIAGATGAGKSVCINTIICSLLLRCTPDEVRLAMIDPKRIELSGYEGIPHLIQSVVTEPDEAMSTLNWAVYEMERRYELLQIQKVRDIISYNLKIEELIKNDEAKIVDKLPYIVLIIDEFADLIMTAGREIEMPIARLAQMARAVGIHLILATQRPSIKVITGVIKANFPARIAFRVSSKVDSRVILDTTGADKLLGRGDMLFLPPGKPNPERIHGAFLSDAEIEGLVEYLKTQPKPPLIITMSKPEVGNLSDFDYDDDLFPEAAKAVTSSNVASVSMLQRHFKIGHARAGRLIDLLERSGVIGPHLGSKPREVLMTPEDLLCFKEKPTFD